MSTTRGTEAVDYNPIYDPFTTEFQENPFPVYKRLRDEAPVYYNEKWDFYALSRFEDVRDAARDPETFKSFEGIDIDDTAKDQSGPGFLPDIDNPRHDQLRGIVQRSFMPRSIKLLTDDIRNVVEGLVDGFAPAGTADIAQDLAWPTPYEIFFNLLGMPHGQEREQLIRWSHGLKDREPGSAALTPFARESTEELRKYLAELLAERRRNPGNDLLTTIVQAEIDGAPFAEEDIDPASEMVGLVFVLYLAGIETTAGLISTIFQELAAKPDQQKALRENPDLIPNAVEEALRYNTPLQVAGRTTSRPVELHGVTIPEGKRVFLVYGAANHDERQFENPEEFNALRPPVRHLAFGEGLHGCLGNPLARLEAITALQVTLPRIGEFELDGPVRRYRTTPNASVLDRLPIRFAPA
jgi:cytochrome P450